MMTKPIDTMRRLENSVSRYFASNSPSIPAGIEAKARFFRSLSFSFWMAFLKNKSVAMRVPR